MRCRVRVQFGPGFGAIAGLAASIMLVLPLFTANSQALATTVLTIVPEPGYAIMDPPLQAMLEAQGFTFSSALTSTEITAGLLVGVGILFFQETPLNDDPLTLAEQSALESFVQAGGGVLIVGEAGPDFGPSNLASRAAPFGVGVLSTVGFETITDFTPHPVTAGLSFLDILGGKSLTVSPPAISLAHRDNGETMVAAAEVGQGRVVIVGDEVWRSHDFGNPTFTSNVFNWFSPEVSVPEPSGLVLFGSVLSVLALVAWRKAAGH